jgi:hypothetical protein
MAKFVTKIERQSAPIIELSDMDRMQNYLFALINLYVYEQPKHPAGQTNYKKLAEIHAEILSVDAWLDKNFGEFINDNNRKFMK